MTLLDSFLCKHKVSASLWKWLFKEFINYLNYMFKIYLVGFHFLDKYMFLTMYLTNKERYLEMLNLTFAKPPAAVNK